MTGEPTASPSAIDARGADLRSRIPADRFEVIDHPLGWRCRACGAEVLAKADEGSAVARLSESAADHALFCGRCDD